MTNISKITLIALTSLAFQSCNKENTAGAESKSSSATGDATPYPLDTCLVSGEKLGSMGDPIVIQHEGQEIKFCCDHCIPKFRENPEKYLTALNQTSDSP